MQETLFERAAFAALQPRALWDKSGRWSEMGAEMFRIQDRKSAELALSPTAEEAFVAAAAEHARLPVRLYQISTKWRDEARPRAGVLRAREFVMKDGYSLHQTPECMERTYEQVCGAYERILRRLTGGTSAWVKARGAAGAMGGSVSHEWHMVIEEGEDTVSKCPVCGTLHNSELPSCCASAPGSPPPSPGFLACEVGHTFQLGQRYTPTQWMGCYGLGVTRLLAALVHVHKTWPHELSPYAAVVVPPPRSTPESEAAVKRVVDSVTLLPHQSVLLFDEGPRVNLNQRIERASLLRAPAIISVRPDGTVLHV